MGAALNRPKKKKKERVIAVKLLEDSKWKSS